MAWIFDAGGNDGFNATRNLLKVENDRHGILFLPLKALLVQVGWTVEGSGNGSTGGQFEFRGTTAGSGTGSGGAFDVWDTVVEVSAVNSWCVLQDPGGVHQLLLIGTGSAGAGFDAYGHVFFLPGGGYLAAGIADNIPPATVAGELEIRGTRPVSGQGANLVNFTGQAYMHLGADDTAINGVYRFYVAVFDDGTNNPHDTWGLMALEGITSWEASPWMFLGGGSGGANTGINVFHVAETQSDGGTGPVAFTSTNYTTNTLTTDLIPDRSNDDPDDATPYVFNMPYIRRYAVADEEYYAGHIPDFHARAHTGLDYPNYFDTGTPAFRYIHWRQMTLPWGLVTSVPPDPLGDGAAADSGAVLRTILEGVVADSTPPVIGPFVPAGGSIPATQSVSVDVTEESGVLQVLLVADYGVSLPQEVIYRDGGYEFPYVGTDLQVGDVTTFAFTRTGGLLSTPFTLDVTARDADNEVFGSQLYTVTGAGPVINNIAPPAPGPLTNLQTVSFDVVSEDAFTIQVTGIRIGGPTETIFTDVQMFEAPYTGTVNVLGNTTSYTIDRGGGWGESPITIQIDVDDGVNQASATLVYTIAEFDLPYPPNMQPFTGGANP